MPSTLYFGVLTGTTDAPGQDVEKVTRNTYPVSMDSPPKEGHAPGFNEVQTDPDPELGFNAPHQVGSEWHQPEKYAPGRSAQLAQLRHDDIVNEVWASSGTAAQREEAGQYGHGTHPYAVGIEPSLYREIEFGTDYFAAHNHDANDTTSYVTGVQSTLPDHDSNGAAMAQYNSMTRYAQQATVSGSLYDDYLAGN